ncbi:MAG: UDP-N-acetylmuramoyl-tripeptide--D-alanyl-D-alanine ligase [Candidatus Atribacteria bacterium]|nr:UDP-N-acetylmuramoyl-tripeptide--D-alanyl-D-alanine ligase [Candidatus Atribacteria bacterium]
MKLNLEDIFAGFGGTLKGVLPYYYHNFVIDSRLIEQGDIFIALRGSRVDGHAFAEDAIEKGAVGIVAEEDVVVDGGFVYRVRSSYDFIKYLGEQSREKFNGNIFGITGSAGKTTTKEGLYLALSTKFAVVKTEGNVNTDISLPLFFANNVNGNEDFAIVEMGVQKPNDMDVLLDIVKPNYAIITNVGESHTEYLGSKEGVLKEKFKLAQFVVENGGVCFINGDDDHLRKAAHSYKDIISVGFNEGNDFQLDTTKDNEGISYVKISFQNRTFEFPLEEVSTYLLYDFGLIFAASLFVGVDPDLIISSLRAFKPYKGRGEKIVIGDMVIINDTYNSNPVSLRAVLTDLSKADAPTVLIIGDMLELGDRSYEIHASFGELVSELSPYLLITYGKYSKALFEASSVQQKFHFETPEAMKEFIETFEFPKNSYILVKGSRAMQMEQFLSVLERRYRND